MASPDDRAFADTELASDNVSPLFPMRDAPAPARRAAPVQSRDREADLAEARRLILVRATRAARDREATAHVALAAARAYERGFADHQRLARTEKRHWLLLGALAGMALLLIAASAGRYL